MPPKNFGKIKWFNVKKGYGFVIPETGGKDLFLHVSGLAEGFQPTDNLRVEYDLGEDRAGRQVACNVYPV